MNDQQVTEAVNEALNEPVPGKFNFLDRLTLICLHYSQGTLFGFNLKIFSPDRNFDTAYKFAAVCVLSSYLSLLVGFTDIQPACALGLLLILFCPQWIYTFSFVRAIQHTIFEYRGYLFAAGISVILADFAHKSILRFGPWSALFGIPIIVLLANATVRRNRIYADPLLFWKQAHLDVQSDSLIASAYLYQLQKRERFGDTDDLFKYMTAARIPSCRAFLINLAAAKFGSKTDVAPFDKTKIMEAVKILEETARRWPNHADVWRNLGTVQYYMAVLGGVDGKDYSTVDAVESFIHALAISPLDSLSHLSIGHCMMYEGRWEDAVTSLTHAYNYLPAGAYIVEEISLVRIKLMEALEKAGDTSTDPVKAMEYRREFGRHQAAFEQYHAYYVTEENAKYIV